MLYVYPISSSCEDESEEFQQFHQCCDLHETQSSDAWASAFLFCSTYEYDWNCNFIYQCSIFSGF